jgi:glycosyltransferase involved in cell wall biosynthesis
MHGEDKTIPTPVEDWKNATVDVVIPAQNEEQNIILAIESLATQSLKPRKVIVIDDASTDKTYEYLKAFSKLVDLDVSIIHRDKAEGKTPSIKFQARESDADVLFVLDGDTILRSENYIERLVQELYQGVGIACSCGVILPLEQHDRERLFVASSVDAFSKQYPKVKEFNPTLFARFQKKIASLYREELYLFLQRFIYHAEMVFFGSIINPIGCAVAYRRKYLKNVFDQYEAILGNDLTTSEDIFIGFAFADYGYRNIQVQGVYALTQEPPLAKLPAQIFKWSSAFLQSCYYFVDLFSTPFKVINVFFLKIRERTKSKEIMKVRKVKEAYRQAFGVEYTKKYGRPIGWYVFFSAFEKITFAFIILLMIIFKFWIILLITFCAEVLLYSTVIAIVHRNRRVKNFFKSICLAPIRYAVLMFDLVVIVGFIKDILFVEGRNWKK